jgi:hypothetical protein
VDGWRWADGQPVREKKKTMKKKLLVGPSHHLIAPSLLVKVTKRTIISSKPSSYEAPLDGRLKLSTDHSKAQ